MSLEFRASTIYIIKSKSTDGAFIGRHITEDKSLLPKNIFLLPKDFPEVPKSPTTPHASDIRNLLFGSFASPRRRSGKSRLNHNMENTNAGLQWLLILRGISVAGKADGWVSPEKEEEQVKVHPLIVASSLPPHYPPDELFEITPGDYE